MRTRDLHVSTTLQRCSSSPCRELTVVISNCPINRPLKFPPISNRPVGTHKYERTTRSEMPRTHLIESKRTYQTAYTSTKPDPFCIYANVLYPYGHVIVSVCVHWRTHKINLLRCGWILSIWNARIWFTNSSPVHLEARILIRHITQFTCGFKQKPNKIRSISHT